MIIMTITCVSVMLAEGLRIARRGITKPFSALSETKNRKAHIEKEHIALTIYGRRCSFAV